MSKWHISFEPSNHPYHLYTRNQIPREENAGIDRSLFAYLFFSLFCLTFFLPVYSYKAINPTFIFLLIYIIYLLSLTLYFVFLLCQSLSISLSLSPLSLSLYLSISVFFLSLNISIHICIYTIFL